MAPVGAKVAGAGVDTERSDDTEGAEGTEGAEETAGAGETERMEGDGADETEGAEVTAGAGETEWMGGDGADETGVGARKPGGGPTNLSWTRPRPATDEYVVVAGLTLSRIIGIFVGMPNRDGTEVDVGGDGDAWLTIGRSGDGGADLDLADRAGGSCIAAK